MNTRWTNQEGVGSNPVFEALHSGLTVRLISTPREDLATCTDDEVISSVLERNTELYDYIPVVAKALDGKGEIVGLLHTAQYVRLGVPNGQVREHRDALSEEVLIGVDASILDFIKNADERPCRLVVSGAGIVGLVSLSDLQKFPVRAALFALVTGLEMTMSEAIRRHFQNTERWKSCLSPDRQKNIEDEIATSRAKDAFVDSLLFTQFGDKINIIAKSFTFPMSKTTVRRELKTIQKLRDKLAHANSMPLRPSMLETFAPPLGYCLSCASRSRCMVRSRSGYNFYSSFIACGAVQVFFFAQDNHPYRELRQFSTSTRCRPCNS